MKKHRLLIYIIVCFVLGLLSVELFNSFYLHKLFGSFFGRPFYVHIGLFCLMFFLTLSLHELTHLFAFYIKGIKSSAIFLLFFVFYKNKQKHWRLNLNFHLVLLGGGLVIPEIEQIDDQASFEHYKKAFAFSLIAAPVMTVLSAAICLVLTLILFYDIPIIVISNTYILLFSALYTYASTFETKQIFGDFKAYNRMKKDETFPLLILSEYATTLTDYHKTLISSFLMKQNNYQQDFNTLTLFQIILEDHVFNSNVYNDDIHQRVLYFSTKKHAFDRLISNQIHFELASLIIYYLDKFNFDELSNQNQTYFIESINDLKLKDDVKTYLLKQVSHITKKTDESSYLSVKKQIKAGPMYFIFKGLPAYYEIEKTKNEGYIKYPLICLIDDEH